MRAAYTLQALARTHRVSLLVVQLVQSPSGASVPAEIAALCQEIAVVTPRETRTSSVEFRESHFDTIHVFRHYMVPYSEPYLQHLPRSRAHLDLDDVEPISRRRIASRYRHHGLKREAAAEEQAADRAEQTHRTMLTRFDRIYVCSEADRRSLPVGVQSRARVLPNVYQPTISLPPSSVNDPIEILFVGTIGYFPNADGIDWFAHDVLPFVRSGTSRQVMLRVIGFGTSPLLPSLRAVPDLDLVGYAPNLHPWYQRSHLIVVPLHAAGGTRIKILEAFAMQRPVVATSIGAEGIDVTNGEHLLIADDPATFAESCLRLIEDDNLRSRLVANAIALLFDRYTPETLATIVAPERALPPR
jgi:glycosyltransferase involved in cell wall biosynthesis